MWLENKQSYGLMENNLVKEQAPPEKNDHPAIWDLVIDDVKHRFAKDGDKDPEDGLAANMAVKDMEDRDQEGLRKYNTRLQPFNGRNALVDAYQEFLDGAVYLRQKIFELENDKPADDEWIELRMLYLDHLDSLVELRRLMHGNEDQA